MKNNKRFPGPSASRCRPGHESNQGARLAAAGYPKFLFRLASARRLPVEHPGTPRRHD